MKKYLQVALAIFIVVGLAWLAKNSLLSAIDMGKCKRSMADIRSVVTAIEAYKNDNGAYPAAMRTETLRSAVEPKYIKQVPYRGLDYFSDGESYAIFTRMGAEEDSSACGCAFEYRDGRFLSWPADLDLTDEQLGTSNLTIE